MIFSDASAPVVSTLTLSCSRDHAFRVYTEQTDDWWPASGGDAAGEAAVVVVEGRRGGRILAVDADGGEHLWGEIDRWVPATAVGHSWHPGGDPADSTRVDVAFDAIDEGCRVTLTHTGPPVVGATGFRGDVDGWRLALERFAALAQAPSRPTLS